MMIRLLVSTASRVLPALICLWLSGHQALADSAQSIATAPMARVNNFDIPAQSLQSSLIEFALQGNVTVVADNQLLQQHLALAIAGPSRIDSALTKLLASSGLDYEYLAESDSIIIVPGKAPLAKLPAPSESLYPVEEVVVTGVRYPFRYNTVTNTQTQGGASYFDSSRFLNVIPQTLLEDQQPSELGDVLKYASGITPGDGASDTNDDIYIRGFQRHAIYLDGFRLSDSSGIKLSPANTERVEILKGPATLFYGQAEPGGIVNVIRKKPQNTRFVNLESGIGSLGRKFINVDINGQPVSDSDIDMRLVAADDRQSQSGEIENIHTQLLAPSIAWTLTDNTAISASYNYQNQTRAADRNIAVFLPYEDFPGASLEQIAPQAQESFSADSSLFNLEINHYFNADWRLRASYFWQEEKRRGLRSSSDALLKSDLLLNRDHVVNGFTSYVFGGQIVIPVNINSSAGGYGYSVGNIRSLYDAADTEYGQNMAANLEGSFVAGDLNHHLSLGADWTRQDVYKQIVVESRNLFPGQTWEDPESIDTILDVGWGLLHNTPISDTFAEQSQQLIYDDYGAYLQDNIELNDRWILSAGSRYTITEGSYANVSEWTLNSLPEYHNVSSQLGLTFKPGTRQSIFISYSEAMRASYHNDDISLQSAVPVLSEQFELGLKSLSDDGRLLSSIAFFDIQKRNIVTVKLVGGYRTALEAHQQNVTGMDLDFTWQASQQLDLMGAFSLLDARIVSGEDAGRRPPMVARQSASLFSHYKINQATHFNLGVKYVGPRLGYSEGVAMIIEDPAADDLLELEGFMIVDLAIDHTFKLASHSPVLTVSAKNLFDKHYYTALLGGFRQNESEGRALVAALEVEF